jgi:hypothetical protein
LEFVEVVEFNPSGVFLYAVVGLLLEFSFLYEPFVMRPFEFPCIRDFLALLSGVAVSFMKSVFRLLRAA